MAISKFFFVLFISSAISAATAKRALAPSPSFFEQVEEEKFLLPSSINPQMVKDCLTEINMVEGCATDFIFSITHLQFNFPKTCCDELAAAGEKCLAPVFNVLPGMSGLIPVLKATCNALVDVAH